MIWKTNKLELELELEMIHKAFRTHATQNPLQKILIFTIYRNYTFSLINLNELEIIK